MAQVYVPHSRVVLRPDFNLRAFLRPIIIFRNRLLKVHTALRPVFTVPFSLSNTNMALGPAEIA